MHVHNLSVILISFKEQSLRNVLKTEENWTEAKKPKQVKEGWDVKYSEEMERNIAHPMLADIKGVGFTDVNQFEALALALPSGRQ